MTMKPIRYVHAHDLPIQQASELIQRAISDYDVRNPDVEIRIDWMSIDNAHVLIESAGMHVHCELKIFKDRFVLAIHCSAIARPYLLQSLEWVSSEFDRWLEA